MPKSLRGRHRGLAADREAAQDRRIRAVSISTVAECQHPVFRVESQGTREGGISMGRCTTRGCGHERLMSNVHSNKTGWGTSEESVARGNKLAASNQKRRAKEGKE